MFFVLYWNIWLNKNRSAVHFKIYVPSAPNIFPFFEKCVASQNVWDSLRARLIQWTPLAPHGVELMPMIALGPTWGSTYAVYSTESHMGQNYHHLSDYSIPWGPTKGRTNDVYLTGPQWRLNNSSEPPWLSFFSILYRCEGTRSYHCSQQKGIGPALETRQSNTIILYK